VNLGKTRPPRLGRVFGRERLFDAIDASPAAAVWIAGPPGIGKTTLVATYLQSRAIPCLWLQLDAEDADPASFGHFLQMAAATLNPVEPQPRYLSPPSADDLRDVSAYVRRCVRRLAAERSLPWALVLDNMQELGDVPGLHSGIAAALAELPEGARIYALSRELPTPAYARAMASQQVELVDETMLRFDDTEAQQLVDLHGRDWHGAELRALTDGWAAAMILLIAARTELGPSAALRSGTARERLFAYFATEVLAGMSAGDAKALMCMAYLPSATAAMAVAVSGNAHAGELLADLTRRSLFTECREGAVAAYTFHALFSEFLRAQATETLAAPMLRALRVNAAHVLSEHDQGDAAITLLIAAEAWPEALQRIESQATGLVTQGRTALLRDAILAVPERARDMPQAWYWLGYCSLAEDPARALQQLEQARCGYQAAGDERGVFCTAAAAADAIVFVGASLQPIGRWMPLLEAHAGTYLKQRDDETDLRVLPGLLAAFVHCATAHPLTAVIADRAERLLDQPLGASQRILLGTLAYYLLWTGQLARLDRMLLKVDLMCAGIDAAPATLLRWYSASVMIRSLRGQVGEALAHARQALAVTRGGPPPLRGRAHLLLVLAALAARDAALARTHLADSAGLLELNNASDSTIYEFQRGMLMLLEGDWTGADQLMRAAVVSGQASGWPLREHIALLGQTLAATQVGGLAEAQRTLAAVFAHPFYAVCRWHHWLASLIEAHLAERGGERARALTALTHAFVLGREYGFDFGPMPYCCGDMMSRLAALALAHDIDAPFALHLIERYALAAPADASARWPWPVRIRCLGVFSIELHGQALTQSRKENRKPLDLLKLTIALGGVAVRADRLTALLWPEAEGDAAQNSFDNALHRLRKLIGETQLLLQAGALSLNPGSCWTDVAALESSLRQAEALSTAFFAEPHDDAALAVAVADQALALYQGDFLAGDESHPDVLVARHRLRASFVRHLKALGAVLEAHGEHAAAERVYRRVIEREPLAEDVVRQLIQCLLVLGRRAEAYEAYRHCRQQMSVLLGIRPAAETEALVETLREP
jgi:DNA-binding SARP family transcriptional activator